MPTKFSHAQVRAQTDKNGEQPSVLDFVVPGDTGNTVPIGNGVSCPLSTLFGTLAAAQVEYPHAVALTDELAWAALQGAVNSVATLGCAVYVPAGVYRLNRALTISSNGQCLRGATHGTSELRFTAATDGIILPTSQQENCILENIRVTSTHASGGKAIKASINEGAGCVMRNISVRCSGSGKWAYGLWLKDFQSCTLDSIDIRAGVSVQIHVEGISNALTMQSVLLAHAKVCALEVDAAIGVTLTGGTIQSETTVALGGAALVKVTGGGSVSLLGTYLEGQGDIPLVICSDSTLVADAVELGGGSCSEAFYATNNGVMRLSKIKGYSSASGYLIRCAGNGGGTAQGCSITDSVVYNPGSGDGILLANQWGPSVSNCQIITPNGNGVQVFNCEGPAIRDTGINAVHSGKYAVVTDGGSVVLDGCWFLVNSNLEANICNHTYLTSVGNWLHGVGQVVPAPTTTTPTYTGLTIDGAAGSPRPVNFTSGGSLRWKVETVGDPESGGNAGSSLWLQPYADNGTTLLNPIKIDRAGNVIIPGSLTAANLELTATTVGGGGTLPSGGAYGATVDIIVNGITRHLLCL